MTIPDMGIKENGEAGRAEPSKSLVTRHAHDRVYRNPNPPTASHTQRARSERIFRVLQCRTTHLPEGLVDERAERRPIFSRSTDIGAKREM